MYKHVKAIAHGTVATSIGIKHFDPDHDDDQVRETILPVADAEKAKTRGLVKIGPDASEEDFQAQQAGFPNTGRNREMQVEGIDQEKIDAAADAGAKAEEETSAPLAGGTAVTTANVRNFPAGDGPSAVPSGGPSDEAPLPEGSGAAAGGAPAKESKGDDAPAAKPAAAKPATK